jgi:hypothetical protein
MPVYLRHVHVSRVIPMSPLGVVDESDEFHQELTEDGQLAVGHGDCPDNQIHVDTVDQEVKDGSHSANTGNGSFCLGLVHLKNIHALFGIEYHVSETMLLNHARVPLRKKG